MGGLLKRYFSESNAIAALSIPIIISHVMFVILEMTNTLIAGRLGPQALAAVSISNAYIFPLILFVFGIQMILSPVVSYYFGRSDFLAIRLQVTQMMVIGFLFGSLLFSALFFASHFFSFLGISPDVTELATQYLHGRMLGVIPFTTLFCLRFFFEGLAKPRPFMIISALCLPLNVLFNMVLMHGFWIFPPLGVFGLGIATSCIELVISFCLFFLLLTPKYRTFKLPPFSFSFDLKTFLSLLKLGIPSGLALAAEVGMFSVAGLFLAKRSLWDIAAHHIVFNISALTFMIPFGISAAMASRIGRLRGRNTTRSQLQFTSGVGLSMSFIFMIFSGLTLWYFRVPITSEYSSAPNVLFIAQHLLGIVAIYQIFDGIQATLSGILKGFQDTRIPMFFMLISYWAVGFCLGYYLGMIKHYGAIGFWTGIGFGFLSSSLFLAYRLIQLLRKIP